MKTRVSLETQKAYQRTLCQVNARPKGWILQVGKPSKPLLEIYEEEGFSAAAFITAYNPRGQKISAVQNRKAQKALLEDIREKKYAFIPALGKDPKGEWDGEPSFLVFGISLKAAKDLGRKYRQNAILFAGRNGRPRLILLR
ncbi:MAG: DUF3293 domain-containing protein [bacterium]